MKCIACKAVVDEVDQFFQCDDCSLIGECEDCGRITPGWGGLYDDGLDEFQRCLDCTIYCSKCVDEVFSVDELNEQGICYNCRDSDSGVET